MTTNQANGVPPKTAEGIPARQQGQGFQDVNSKGVNPDVAALVKSAEGITIESGEDLHQFLDAIRALNHKVAMITSMAGGELVENVRAEARKPGKTSMISLRDLPAIKKVGREMARSAEAQADSAQHLVAAWNRYQGFCEDIAERVGKKQGTGSRRGFKIGME